VSTGGTFDRLTRAIDGLLRNNDLARREADRSRQNNDKIARLLQSRQGTGAALHEGPTRVLEARDRLIDARNALQQAQANFATAQRLGRGVQGAQRHLRESEREVIYAEAGVLRSEASLTGAQLSGQQAAEEEQRTRDADAEQRRQAQERQDRERSPNFAAASARLASSGLGFLNRTLANPNAAVREGQERGGLAGLAQQGLGGLAAGAQRQGPAGGATAFLQGAGNLLSLVPGVGQTAGAFLNLAGTVVETIDKIRGMARAAHEANMALAEFSPSMAAVKARQDMRDFILNMQKGEAKAKTAEGLAQSMSRLDRTLAPVEVFWDNAWGGVKRDLGDFVDLIVAPLVKIAQDVGILPELGSGKVPPYQESLGKIAAAYENWYETEGRPPRHDTGFGAGAGGDF